MDKKKLSLWQCDSWRCGAIYKCDLERNTQYGESWYGEPSRQ